MADRANLRVDLDGLTELSGDLALVREKMTETSENVDSSTEILGSSKVKDALHDFEHRWKAKREEIDGNAEALIGMLDASVENFTTVDNDLAAALTESSEEKQIGGPGSAGRGRGGQNGAV